MSGPIPPHPRSASRLPNPKDADGDEPNIRPSPETYAPSHISQSSAGEPSSQRAHSDETNVNEPHPDAPRPTSSSSQAPLHAGSSSSTSTVRGRGRPRKIPKPAHILDVVLGTTERPCQLPKPIADTLAQLYAHHPTHRLAADPAGRQLGPWNDFTRLLHGTYIRSLSGEQSQEVTKEPALLRRGIVPAALLLYYQVAGQEPPPYESKNDRTTQAYMKVINVDIKPDFNTWGIRPLSSMVSGSPVVMCRNLVGYHQAPLLLVSRPEISSHPSTSSAAANQNNVFPGDNAEITSEYRAPNRKRRRSESGGASSEPEPLENGCRSYHPAPNRPSPLSSPNGNGSWEGDYNQWMESEAQKGMATSARSSTFPKQVAVHPGTGPMSAPLERRNDGRGHELRPGDWNGTWNEREFFIEERKAKLEKREELVLKRESQVEKREARVLEAEDNFKRSQALQNERQQRQDERHVLQQNELRRIQALLAERQIRQDARHMLQEKREEAQKKLQFEQDETRARQNAREDGQDERARRLVDWESDLRTFYDEVVRKANEGHDPRRRIPNFEDGFGRLEREQQQAQRERVDAANEIADIQRRREVLKRWEAELAQNEDAYRAREKELERREQFNHEWGLRLSGQAEDLALQRAQQVVDHRGR